MVLLLFVDDKIESLIQRAEQALNSPSLGINNQSDEQSSPGGTEEDLGADRSWDNPPVTLLVKNFFLRAIFDS